MIKEQIDKIKNLTTKDDANNKKKIENLVAFLVILIITIIAINYIWSGNKKKNITEESKEVNLQVSEVNNEDNSELENRLESILTKIEGVGDVKVLVTYSESTQMVALYNENTKETSTEETDTSGGKRAIKESDTQKDVIYKEDNSGTKEPITQKTIMPKIEGAIITAQGAADVDVRTNIIQAVEAVTGLATHKIQVFQMKN